MAGVVEVIWGGSEAEYFYARDWTEQITLKSLQKFVYARTHPPVTGLTGEERLDPNVLTTDLLSLSK
jgi:hypothetical protein